MLQLLQLVEGLFRGPIELNEEVYGEIKLKLNVKETAKKI